jgi:hypothetical protein
MTKNDTVPYNLIYYPIYYLSWRCTNTRREIASERRKKLGSSQWRFYKGFHNINYFIISDLIMICYCIYKERDETSFMRMKLVQLISKVLKMV